MISLEKNITSIKDLPEIIAENQENSPEMSKKSITIEKLDTEKSDENKDLDEDQKSIPKSKNSAVMLYEDNWDGFEFSTKPFRKAISQNRFHNICKDAWKKQEEIDNIQKNGVKKSQTQDKSPEESRTNSPNKEKATQRRSMRSRKSIVRRESMRKLTSSPTKQLNDNDIASEYDLDQLEKHDNPEWKDTLFSDHLKLKIKKQIVFTFKAEPEFLKALIICCLDSIKGEKFL